MRHMLQCSVKEITEGHLEPVSTPLNQSYDVVTRGNETEIQTKRNDSKDITLKISNEESTSKNCKNKSRNNNTTERQKLESSLLVDKADKAADKKLNHKMLKKVRFEENKKTSQRKEESPSEISMFSGQKRTRSQQRPTQINDCKKKSIMKEVSYSLSCVSDTFLIHSRVVSFTLT